MYKRAILTAWAILATGMALADFNPEIKARGGITTNAMVLWYDGSGRWVHSGDVGWSTNTPAIGQVYMWDGSSMVPTNVASGWMASTGLTNSGSYSSPTGQLNAASIASLLLADSALQAASTQSLVTATQLSTATNAAVIDATNRVAGVGYAERANYNVFASSNRFSGSIYLPGSYMGGAAGFNATLSDSTGTITFLNDTGAAGIQIGGSQLVGGQSNTVYLTSTRGIYFEGKSYAMQSLGMGGYPITNVASIGYTNGSTRFTTANGTNYWTMTFAGTNWNLGLK